MTAKYRRRLCVMIGCTVVTFCLHRYEPDIMQSLIDSAGIVGIALLVLDKED